MAITGGVSSHGVRLVGLVWAAGTDQRFFPPGFFVPTLEPVGAPFGMRFLLHFLLQFVSKTVPLVGTGHSDIGVTIREDMVRFVVGLEGAVA